MLLLAVCFAFALQTLVFNAGICCFLIDGGRSVRFGCFIILYTILLLFHFFCFLGFEGSRFFLFPLPYTYQHIPSSSPLFLPPLIACNTASVYYLTSFCTSATSTCPKRLMLVGSDDRWLESFGLLLGGDGVVFYLFIYFPVRGLGAGFYGGLCQIKIDSTQLLLLFCTLRDGMEGGMGYGCWVFKVCILCTIINIYIILLLDLLEILAENISWCYFCDGSV